MVTCHDGAGRREERRAHARERIARRGSGLKRERGGKVRLAGDEEEEEQWEERRRAGVLDAGEGRRAGSVVLDWVCTRTAGSSEVRRSAAGC